MLAQNDQPTKFDRRKASLNPARSTDVAIPSYLLTLDQLCANSGRSIVVRHSSECSGSMSEWVRAIMWGFVLLLGCEENIYLFIYLLYPQYSIPEGWNIKLQKLSWMVTMRAQKLWTCQLGMSRWSLYWQALEKERRFTGIWGVCCHLGQTLSDLWQELLGADTHESKCFQCHWKKLWVPLSEL